ncbi:MAG: BLUF domain-containing protein [Akkermansiaceae bacterium]|nr:BLUF domain-containing protein [Akkermansiaceae bacterium]NNM28628.1 BLUF domain-containing protein [Akkermansiaceae bacterium]
MSSDPLYSLLYTSQAVTPFSAGQLDRLLERSRATNEDLGITGMLVHLSGSFMQVLEGPRSAVGDLYYRKILRDPRHGAVEVVTEGDIAQRQFAQWTMAFEDLAGETGARPEGFSNFVSGGFSTELRGEDQSLTVAILGKFREVFGPRDAFDARDELRHLAG